jgi:hypothetical protein
MQFFDAMMRARIHAWVAATAYFRRTLVLVTAAEKL